MRRLTGYVTAVAGRILFIGFTLQIILGIIWMTCNFAHLQQFSEVNSLLYTVIFTIAEGMGKLCPIPYYCFIYVLQIIISFVAVYFFSGILQDIFIGSCQGKTEKNSDRSLCLYRVWATIAVITSLPVMQNIMALLPYAVSGALLLTEIGIMIQNVRAMQRNESLKCRSFVAPAVLWLSESLFLHEYLLFGAVPFFVILIMSIIYNRADIKKNVFSTALVLLAVTAVSSGIYGLCRRTGVYTESNPGLVKGMLSRTAFTTTLRDWNNWTDSIVENIDADIRYSASYYADNITLELEPYVDEKFGSRADEFYKDTIKDAWSLYKTQIIHESVWDAAGYLLSPVIIKRQLEGQGYTSLTARNYDMMKRSTPIITMYYVNYFLEWFTIALVILLICAVVAIKSVNRKKMISLAVPAAVYGVMCVRYVIIGAGIMDYKRTAVITASWILLMTLPAAMALKSNNSGENYETVMD